MTLDLTGTLTNGPLSVCLTRQEATLLRSLLRTPGCMVPRKTLQRAIGAVNPKSLDVAACRLRAKLAQVAGPDLVTVFGRGYVLRGTVDETVTVPTARLAALERVLTAARAIPLGKMAPEMLAALAGVGDAPGAA